MDFSKIKSWVILLALLFCKVGYAQSDPSFKSLSLLDLNAFLDPPQNWIVASDANADFTKPQNIMAIKGTGAVVNAFSKNNRMHLYTKEEFGDLDLELDFMMAKNSNSGVYLQGRYEIQLLDSWTRLHPTASDAGGIYSRWNSKRGTYEGTAPTMNVAKAPGLWQHLHIIFRAPIFNNSGDKIANARFERVYLNGVLIQQNAFVTGPTGSSMFQDEKAKGPLVLQGDHGPVAFKNIQYRGLAPLSEISLIPNDTTYWENRNPILINPSDRPYLLRSFMNFGNKKLTHVVSVGFPSQVSFSYDLKQGAIFQVWRGKYLDVTRMWNGRGEPQLAIPMGSVILLSDAPVIAVLKDDKAAWPDSIAFDDLQHHGYKLDNKRTPVFRYTTKDINVVDSIAELANGEGLIRTLTVSGAPANTYCRIAAGSNIEGLSAGLYAVAGKSYYVEVSKKDKPLIRQTATGQELILPVVNNEPVTYAVIW